MAIYRPKYRDQKTGKLKQSRIWWYHFVFAGRHVQESSKSPTDPENPATSFKTVSTNIRTNAGIKGRWVDNRHTFITDLADSGEASDETIRDIAGHVSQQLLKHYSHSRMRAKRRAVDALVRGSSLKNDAKVENSVEPAKVARAN